MKRLIALLFCLLALSVHSMWVSGGVKVNPTAGLVIADTGAISGGASTYTVIVAANAAARFELAVRNAANNADVAVQNFFVPANGNFTAMLPIDVPPDGRIVIRTPAAITGSVQGSIMKDGPA